MKTASLFEEQRLTRRESRDLTVRCLNHFRQQYNHWIAAYSGGKDSTGLIVFTVYAIEQGWVERPESLTVLLSNTRMEFIPLFLGATQMMDYLAGRDWIKTKIVEPPLDHRFFVYMFGYGVPPPTNRMRWCTRLLKGDPMDAETREIAGRVGERLLTLTGLRLGESFARDQRIVTACTKDGGECGQGWFFTQDGEEEEGEWGLHFRRKRRMPADSLAPILHWRLCHLQDFLGWELSPPEHNFPTGPVMSIYGYADTEAEMQSAGMRTGCAGCNLVEEDRALKRILSMDGWEYLQPLLRLQPLYRELREKRSFRLRKHMERNKDGRLSAKQGRLGPLTMEARRYGLSVVLEIQDEINQAARASKRPEITLLDKEEISRIHELIEANTWPQRWDGTEFRGDVLLPEVYSEDLIQPLLLAE